MTAFLQVSLYSCPTVAYINYNDEHVMGHVDVVVKKTFRA